MAAHGGRQLETSLRPTRRGAILAFLLGSLGVWLFSEAVLRFIVPRSESFPAAHRMVLFPRYVRDVQYRDYRIRQNIPNARYFHTSVDGRWEFRINAQGFRSDRDFPIEKPDQTIRIATLGDSMTAGYEARQELIYPTIVERYLTKHGIRAEVLNAGVPGFGTAEELVVLENYLLEFGLDYVVLGFYRNDYNDNIKAGLFGLEQGKLVATSYAHVPGIDVANFLYRYTPHPWLNEHSWAYTYLFNAAYDLAKASLGRASLQNLREDLVAVDGEVALYQEELTLALLRRMRETCRENAIGFILVDIPSHDYGPSLPEEVLLRPEDYADVVLWGTQILGDYLGVVDVFVPHGQRHLNELGHLALGIEVGTWIHGTESVLLATKGG